MWYQIANKVASYIDRMEQHDYLLMAAIAIIVGVVCMRGFRDRI